MVPCALQLQHTYIPKIFQFNQSCFKFFSACAVKCTEPKLLLNRNFFAIKG